jgi:hypothetical protein
MNLTNGDWEKVAIGKNFSAFPVLEIRYGDQPGVGFQCHNYDF